VLSPLRHCLTRCPLLPALSHTPRVEFSHRPPRLTPPPSRTAQVLVENCTSAANAVLRALPMPAGGTVVHLSTAYGVVKNVLAHVAEAHQGHVVEVSMMRRGGASRVLRGGPSAHTRTDGSPHRNRCPWSSTVTALCRVASVASRWRMQSRPPSTRRKPPAPRCACDPPKPVAPQPRLRCNPVWALSLVQGTFLCRPVPALSTDSRLLPAHSPSLGASAATAVSRWCWVASTTSPAAPA
jgi:hypothetical protein